MEMNHHTPHDVIIEELSKAFIKNIELRGMILSKINATRGGEQLAWIKKYNGLFVLPYSGKRR